MVKHGRNGRRSCSTATNPGGGSATPSAGATSASCSQSRSSTTTRPSSPYACILSASPICTDPESRRTKKSSSTSGSSPSSRARPPCNTRSSQPSSASIVSHRFWTRCPSSPPSTSRRRASSSTASTSSTVRPASVFCGAQEPMTDGFFGRNSAVPQCWESDEARTGNAGAGRSSKVDRHEPAPIGLCGDEGQPQRALPSLPLRHPATDARLVGTQSDSGQQSRAAYAAFVRDVLDGVGACGPSVTAQSVPDLQWLKSQA